MEIISLYDFSGEALKPWAHAGYACYAYDIEHPPSGRMSEGIHYEHADLHDARHGKSSSRPSALLLLSKLVECLFRASLRAAAWLGLAWLSAKLQPPKECVKEGTPPLGT